MVNLQIDIDIGSSSVARGVVGLVLGYVTSVVVDLAILVEVISCPSFKNRRLLCSYIYMLI